MSIVIVGAFDTKGEEIGFACDVLEEQGVGVHLVGVDVLGRLEIKPDTDAVAVTEAGGSTLEIPREAGDRGKTIEIMDDGTTAIVSRLHSEGQLDSTLGLGGGGNTPIVTAVMCTLPMGVPKLMLPTMASGDMELYIGYHDITMMHPVADTEGLNQPPRTVISNATLAMVDAVSNEPDVETEEKPTIGIIMSGVTTPCVQRVRDWLEMCGYETVVFHTTGTGGRVVEPLVEEGVIDGVLDVATTEWVDELIGGVLATGSGQSDAVAKRDILRAVSTGAFDMINSGPKDSISDEFDGRQFHVHNPQMMLMRTVSEENAELGRIIAGKLNAATGPTMFALLLGGVSVPDAGGEVFHDPEADDALLDALREHLDDDVELIQSSANINDDEFALILAEVADRRTWATM